MRDSSATEAFPDCLAVLGLGPGADVDEIRTAYRRLAKRYHPDGSKDPGTARQFARVARAYKLLVAREDAYVPSVGLSAGYRHVMEAGEDLFALGSILTSDLDPGAREAAVRRLGLSGRTAAYVFLRRALYDSDDSVAAAAVRAVALLGCRQAEGEVAALYSRSSRRLRSAILDAAEATNESLFRSALRSAKSDEDATLKLRALVISADFSSRDT